MIYPPVSDIGVLGAQRNVLSVPTSRAGRAVCQMQYWFMLFGGDCSAATVAGVGDAHTGGIPFEADWWLCSVVGFGSFVHCACCIMQAATSCIAEWVVN